MAPRLIVRRPAFTHGPDTPACWTPERPELACAANSVSLLMPFMEPYFVRSVAVAVSQIDEPLRSVTRAYLAQESEHHRQHRAFNRILVARYPRLVCVERWADRFYRLLERRATEEFNLAFVAVSETIAYSAARWAAANRSLFDRADPDAAAVFWWHLTEEVEHKAIAHEVFAARGGRRRIYLAALVVALASVACFVAAGTTLMLAAERRLLDPRSWIRLSTWAVRFVFELLPNLAMSALPGFHPDDLVDPLLFDMLRRERGHDGLSCARPPLTPSVSVDDNAAAASEVERQIGCHRTAEPTAVARTPRGRPAPPGRARLVDDDVG